VSERFVIENIGPQFYLLRFSEYLHMDDRARVRDYNNDTRDETLLAINSFTTIGYPVFGKVYLRHEEIYTDLISDGRFAIVTHNVNHTIPLGSRHDLARAAYVTSMAKEASLAEMQVAKDANTLLGNSQTPDQWYVRSYNTDDAGAVFINGEMVTGSRYSSYPDTGLVAINKYWKQVEDNYVSFASWDYGICCNSTWGFSLKRNVELLWNFQASGSTKLGIVYRKILRVTPSGQVIEYEQTNPDLPLEGDWSVQIRTNNGIGFVLVDNLPVAGSIGNRDQIVTITNLLGRFENKVHLNIWADGGGTLDLYFAIRNGENVLWQYQINLNNPTRGRIYHGIIAIDADGNVYPKLDLPVDYDDRTRGSARNFNSAFTTRLTSLFDHELPNYDEDDHMLPYIGGKPGWNPKGADECTQPGPTRLIQRLYCYDGHSGYDIDDSPCSSRSACTNVTNITAVYPAADGKIIPEETGWSDPSDPLGCKITIDHGNQWKTIYAHLLDAEKDRNCEGILRDSGNVTRYDPIGIIGCTGKCYGAHLHFEVRHNDIVVDPSGWDPIDQVDPWAHHPAGSGSYPQWLYREALQQTVSTDTGGQLITQAGTVQLTIPADYHETPLTFNLSVIPVADLSDQLVNSGIAFSLTAIDTTGVYINQFDRYLELQVIFALENLQDLAPNTVSIYSWDPASSNWMQVPTIMDFENLEAIAQIDHLSIFALMGKPMDKIYLPLVNR
jgi:hypothetical protein